MAEERKGSEAHTEAAGAKQEESGAALGNARTAEATALKLASDGILQIIEKTETLAINQNTLGRLPKTVIRRLDGLRLLDEEYERVHAKLVKERKELEERYRRRFMPLLMQRTEVINKRLDPSDIDIKADDTDGLPVKLPPPAAKDSDEDDSSDEDIPGTPGVPGFWLQAMSNNEVISQLISERDEDCLAHLIDIRSEPLTNFEGFKIVFHFAPNKYFTNSELVKTFRVPNMMDGSEPVLESVDATPVKWKRGKQLNIVAVKEKSRIREAGRRKRVTRLKPCESFFNIFSGPILSGLGANEHDDHEELLNQIDADFEIGLTFKDKLIPRAYTWYTGEAADQSSDDESAFSDEDEENEFRGMFSSGPHGDEDLDTSDEEEVTRDEIRQALAEAFRAKIPPPRAAVAPGAAASAAPTSSVARTAGSTDRPRDEEAEEEQQAPPPMDNVEGCQQQ